MPASMSRVFEWGTYAICAVAGIWTLFHLYWELAKQTSDDLWGAALLVLFVVSLILAFARYAQDRSALFASTPSDEFPEPAIARFFLGTSGAAALWFVVRMNVGAQWLLAGWEKVQEPAWGTSGKR